MKEFRPGEWCWDPYARVCDACDTIIGRFGVLTDALGWRQVAWWPHPEWDGISGSFRCRDHATVTPEWRHLFEDLA